MSLIRKLNILIVGLGLIGGSYAKGLKRLGFTVNAITKEQNDVEFAMQNGIVDYATTEIEPKIIKNANLVIFALYPHVFIDWIKENQHLFNAGTVLTDVTGVKKNVCEDIQKILRDDVEFIAAHPMAGKEVYGVRNSDDGIFKGANYIVVPTEKNTNEAIELCKSLGQILGFKKVTVLSASEHDKMIAYLSQLTHCIAVSLMCCNDTEGLEAYTGDSFRDLTRIARINENMWSELFLMNKEPLLNEMKRFKETFDELYYMLENDDKDGIKEMMKISTNRRILFDKT